MARADIEALRRVMAEQRLTEEQVAALAGVTAGHVRAVLSGKRSPDPALGRVIYPPSSSPAPSETQSPIAAALAVVQAAMQSEADESRAVASAVTEAASAYARTVEERIAHTMLATVGRAHGAPPDVHGAALDLVSCVQRIPELGALFAAPAPAPSFVETPVVATESAATPVETEVAADEPTSDAPSSPCPWPLLAAASQRRPVVIVGGVPVGQVLQHVRSGNAVRIEWPEVGKLGGERVVQSLDQRIRANTISALVFVQGFLRHSYSELLRGSATSRAIRVAYAGTGGKASMVRAFDEIERSLRVRGAA